MCKRFNCMPNTNQSRSNHPRMLVWIHYWFWRGTRIPLLSVLGSAEGCPCLKRVYLKTQRIITVPAPCLGRPFALKITAAKLLMGEETQTSGNSSWSTAGGLEEVAKKGLPHSLYHPKWERENEARKRENGWPGCRECAVGLGIFQLELWTKLSLARHHPQRMDTPHPVESPSLPLCVTSGHRMQLPFKPKDVCSVRSFQL